MLEPVQHFSGKPCCRDRARQTAPMLGKVQPKGEPMNANPMKPWFTDPPPDPPQTDTQGKGDRDKDPEPSKKD